MSVHKLLHDLGYQDTNYLVLDEVQPLRFKNGELGWYRISPDYIDAADKEGKAQRRFIFCGAKKNSLVTFADITCEE